MARENVLDIASRAEFRAWLEGHAATERECYVDARHSRPQGDDVLWYIDAVEEALCFGWIDSTIRMVDGRNMQRFSPRKRGSNWTELNKERVRRLESLGLMTDAGRATLPPMGPRSFRVDADVEADLKRARAWSAVRRLPALYQRVRLSNLAYYRSHHPDTYPRMLSHVVETARRGETFGNWNDYGRLLDY